MAPLTLAEFEHNLRQFFWADDVDRAQVERLYDHFTRFAADPAKVRGQDVSLFRIENAEPVFGALWWEQRQNGSDRIQYPISWQDRASMLLTTDLRADPRPPVRLHCPGWAAGSWQVDGGGRWELGADERFEASDRATRRPIRWCVHLAAMPELWLLGTLPGRPERYDIVKHTASQLELRPAAESTRLRLVRC